MSGNKFNSIVILDSIPDGELNTARRLEDTLLNISNYHAEGLGVIYFRLNNKNDLEKCTNSILKDVREIGLLPWFHLEAHGMVNGSGFELADGTSCSWEELKKYITPINIATNLNVVLILATCFGGTFAKSICTYDRAPVSALVGPEEEVTVGEIEIAFPAFYKSLFESFSLRNALSHLDQETTSCQYYSTSATNFFYEVWCSYKIKLCNEKGVHKQAKRHQTMLKKESTSRVPGLGAIKRFMASTDEEIFNKFRDIYFLNDLNPENIIRFDVSYTEANKQILRDKTIMKKLTKRSTRTR